MSKTERRHALKFLYDCGSRDAKEWHKITKIPLRTCARNLAKFRAGKGPERAGGGRPKKKLGKNDRRRITQLANNHPKWSCKRIAQTAANRGSPLVSGMTIYRNLKDSGIFHFVPKKVPLLTEKHIRDRLAWCEKYKNFNWENVVFTDESTFQLFRDVCKEWARKRPTKMVAKYSPKFMIWGGISMRGKTEIHIVEGSIDSEYYQTILNENMIVEMNILYPDGWWLMQDNASCHVLKSTMAWLEKRGVRVIEWPANSPDLNPIENIWGMMKLIISREEPTSLGPFKEVVKNVWAQIDTVKLENFIKSMPKRLELCVANKGLTIKY
jgi:hypothetical protein